MFIIRFSIFITFTLSVVQAQDQRFFKEFLSRDLKREASKEPEKYHFRSFSPFYHLDLNGDQDKESFIYELRDGHSFLNVKDSKGKQIYRYQFEGAAGEARPYQVSVRDLSTNTKVLVFHFYEGKTDYIEFKGTARLYFMTIDNQDLSTISIYKGPSVFEEFESLKKRHYHQRKYELRSVDYNNDGVKELSIHYNKTSKVYFYKDKGKWLTM